MRESTSFQELKAVKGQQATYWEACETLGILEDDKHWDATMEEAVLCRSPTKLRAISFRDHVNEMELRLVPEQREIFNKILPSIENMDGGFYFLDTPGGAGETFVLNLLLAQLRKDRNIVLVISSGIAAMLLSGGRSVLSVFKLLLNLETEETPMCNISKSSSHCTLLQQFKLIVCDECTMSHKRAVEVPNTA
ncbi:hypothetical protein PR048_003057 [Dryococelus australis]|uniref:ATP-dependent DNA helicase n=1 Tax=Dryococelus australis TaxID=614101 RepID=A0ABQ9IM13_9NEOP|nr:hypothetical protein PR048_003057 [Dryococelus australis]